MPSPSDAHIDVLLHNPEGFITETSIRNVAFRRNNRWVTPTTASGCLPGVLRRLVLEEYDFVPLDVNVKDVVPEELVLTFNGVEGIQWAKIVGYLGQS
jgi:4-amino-4-deoxychorismate lyase